MLEYITRLRFSFVDGCIVSIMSITLSHEQYLAAFFILLIGMPISVYLEEKVKR